MIAAIVGLIGVIAGAIITGVLSLMLEQRTRRRRARTAAVLIKEELYAVLTKLRTALAPSGAEIRPQFARYGQVSYPEAEIGVAESISDVARQSASASGTPTPRWWSGDLPVEAWKTYQSDLANVASPKVMEVLASTYAICISLNAEHKAAETPMRARGPVWRWLIKLGILRSSNTVASERPRGPQGDLEEYIDTITEAMNRLEVAPGLGTPNPRQKTVRWATALAVPAVLLVLAVAALAAPRPDVNAMTVTSAMQSQLGANTLVECQPSASEWACNVYKASGQTSCLVASTRSSGLVKDTISTDAARLSTYGNCDVTSTATATAAVNSQGLLTADVLERQGHVETVKVVVDQLKKTNALVRAWRAIWGP